ncbi:MAG: sulfatase [Xanthomonadales bacterium]|nr:sulfatase [Xanthomonadales bacterium]
MVFGPAWAGPNIVLVLADDQGWRDSGAYGNPDVKTTNIDALAGQGMKFTHAFTATAMCAPTRQQLYTGLYPVHSGAYPQNSFVREGTRSLAHYFGELGYRVGISGKRHYAPAAAFPFESLNSSGTTNDKEVPEMDMIREFVNRDPAQPFLLLVTSRQPHTPWNKGDVFYAPDTLDVPADMPDTAETRKALASYYREVSDFDAELGRVMAIVDESGKTQDTMFIYTSEQGAMFPGGKWTLYDGGVRTAFVVRWPGVVEPGSETDAMVEYVDVVPTLVEAAGATAPDVDGSSFLSVLKGLADVHDEYVFGVQTTLGVCNGVPYPIRSVRDARYKLIVNGNSGIEFSNNITVRDPVRYYDSWRSAGEAGNAFAAERHLAYRQRPAEEFYDLGKDPQELHNLAGEAEYEADIQRLRKVLQAWLEEQGDADPMATETAAKQHILPGGLRKLSTARCSGG